MSLIDVQTQTRQETIANYVAFAKKANAANYSILKNFLEKSFNDVWNNPRFTPQEIFDAYGTDAVQLFVVAEKTIELLTLLNSEFKAPTAPVQVTINKDGTVTVPVNPPQL